MAKLTGDVRKEYDKFVLGGGAEERSGRSKEREGVHANEASGETEETAGGDEEEEEERRERGGGGRGV